MLRKLLSGFAVLAALIFVSMQPAAAQQRIALVIGNAAYPKGPLQHSLADGGLVAEALTSIGFEIVEGAVHDAGQVVLGQADPVIGDAVLREVVRADLLAAIARADLALARGRQLTASVRAK